MRSDGNSSPKTSNDVSAAGSSNDGLGGPDGSTSGCASCAGPDAAAAVAAAWAAATTSCTRATDSAEFAEPVTVPAAPFTTATTNQDSDRDIPLVVTVLLAHRTLASVLELTTITQPSDLDAARPASMI